MVSSRRLLAIDWMRGFVMILMITDHASSAFNAERPWKDSVHLFTPADLPSTLEFLFRWASHLCAPTFVFLAGTSLAIKVQRSLARGEDSWTIDRDLLVRGAIIASVDVLMISWLFPDFLLLQVMYVIGLSMMSIVVFRRMKTWAVLSFGLAVLVGGELLFRDHSMIPMEVVSAGNMANAVLLSAGMFPSPVETLQTWSSIYVAYPLLPWMAIMLLGWAFGQLLQSWEGAEDRDRKATRFLLKTGLGALGLFAMVRGWNSYGNLSLLRLDGSLVEWLRVSKYPPSLSYVALELGCMALLLALFFRLQSSSRFNERPNSPLLVFGQTAFFFYVAHMPLLDLTARALGMHKQAGLAAAALASILGLAVMYPLCRWYRELKRAHPASILRYG